MTQNTISACDLVMNFSAFVNKVTISADQSGFSRSRLTRNLGYFPSNLRSENALNNVEFSMMRNSKLRSRILASAFPSEEGKSKLSSSFDSQLFDRNEVRVDIEEVSSFSYSRPDLLKNDNRPLSEAELLDKLKAIRLHVLASEQWNSSRIRSCHRTYSASAKNLIHYEALQGLDIEQVKKELSLTDLMNWDIDNSCVLASLEACIRLLESSSLNSTNVKEKVSVSYSEKLTVSSARNKAFSNARSLLGPLEEEKTSHVMVTIGSEAIENERLVDDLVNNGASIVRINCAHGDPSEWSEIIRRVRTSSQMAEKPCRVLMDLAGPKLRTGKLSPGPNVVKVSPKRDAFGNVSSPAQVWLSHRGAGPAPIHVTLDASFVIDGPDFLTQLGVGNTVGFKDARGKKRAFKISKKFHVFSGVGLVAECTETSYVESGTKLRFDKKKREFHFGIVVDVPASEQFLRVRVGDLLIISRERSAESLCSVGDDAHRITCPSSLLFDSVRPGQPISFDDGKIEGTIEGAGASEIVISIRHAKPGKGTKLGAEKSINVPESDILFQGLSSKDLLDLEFVASQADMVGVSFLRGVDDIIALHRELENRRISGSLGIVLKIETRSGFDNLSEMIMEAMKCPNPLGVMIARGDLAVECGWERLAGIQQEILSICKAAHIPVIWATQVLETFLKSGVPTRAEITDASTGRRANCVMLNKGRHVVEAVSFLGTMLRKS